MYGKTHKYSKGTHHTTQASSVMLPQGKAIPTGQHKMNWTPSVGGQKAGLVSAGTARMRRTLKNRRPQGTGHSGGKGGNRLRIPKVNVSGHYPLREEAPY